jgi:hypothetical protein
LSFIISIFLVREILQRADFEHIVLHILDNSGSSILDEVVHAVEGLEDSSPLLLAAREFGPEVLHDHVVVIPIDTTYKKQGINYLPVVGVVSEDLQLRVGDVPVLIGGSFSEDFLVFRLVENA